MNNQTVEIRSLRDLYDVMSNAYRAKDRELMEKLYAEFYLPLIMAEGFNQKQAEAISYEAYERGHSAGILECVNVTFGLIEFARKIKKAN